MFILYPHEFGQYIPPLFSSAGYYFSFSLEKGAYEVRPTALLWYKQVIGTVAGKHPLAILVVGGYNKNDI